MIRFPIVLMALALAGCSSGRTARAAGTEERTTLQVDNRAFVDMTVYVVAGQRVRLGLAVGKTTSVFTIPARVVGAGRELQFVADPIGSDRAAVSDRLYVRAGERVTLMIPP